MARMPPAQAALMRAGPSTEELRMREERQEQERAAQRQKAAEAKRKAEVCVHGHSTASALAAASPLCRWRTFGRTGSLSCSRIINSYGHAFRS